MDNSWNVELLRDLVGKEAMEEILQTKISGCNGLDRCVWKSNPNGKFSTTSAWEAIKNKQEILSWHECRCPKNRESIDHVLSKHFMFGNENF